ncbi:hypothetical protein CVT26_005416 [Gymnopilus dilepis]|uniref:Uncharacterized protein n=1 Tax=Gymnopilus dilepis TaxID=231916 RepID=A0A409WGL7_9AGAR|nr:hypothetical protein CVT26_005416 [Gymnopilus dilepis]
MWYGSDLALLTDLLVKRDELEISANTSVERRAVKELAELTESICELYEALQAAGRFGRMASGARPEQMAIIKSGNIIMSRLLEKLEDEKRSLFGFVVHYSIIISQLRQLINGDEELDNIFQSILVDVTNLRDKISKSKEETLQIAAALKACKRWAHLILFCELVIAVVTGVVITVIFMIVSA